MLGIQARRGWRRQIRRRAGRRGRRVHRRPSTSDRPNPDTVVGNLSGGNQQKVLLARWLATAPELLILDEPTRGIDVGAKADIQRKVAELSEQGLSVIFISVGARGGPAPRPAVVVMRDRRDPSASSTPRKAVDLNGLIDYIANRGQ